MNRPYGPWATLISAGQNPQLSAFWRRRLGMLASVSQSSPALSRRQMLILTGVAAATAALPTIRAATAEAEPPKNAEDALEKIRAAWEKRRASLTSFWYECEFKQNGYRLPPNPNGARNPRVDGHGTFSLGRAGEKVAWVLERDEREDSSDKLVTRKNLVSYNIVHYQSLVETSGFTPLGGIATADRLNKPDARDAKDAPTHLRDEVRVFVHQTAFWTWFSPDSHLQDLGYPPEKMRVNRLHVSRNGCDCLEAALQAVIPDAYLAKFDASRHAEILDGAAQWQLLLYIDPARDYLPVAWVQRRAGVTMRQLEIQYAREQDGMWRVSAWEDKLSDQSGKLYQTSSFEVKRCSINKPLHDDLFTFEFPKRAEVIDYDSNPPKYFVALGKGKRRYISEKEYGAIHNEPPVP